MYKPALKDKNGKWKVCDFVMNERNTDFLYEKDINGQLTPKVKMTDVDCPVRKQLNFMGEEQPVSGFTDNAYYWGKVRKLSMTINLTTPDQYKGGNLKFDFGPHAGRGRFKTCQEIRPQGSIIVFPSFIQHQVTPVTSGTRYSLVVWSLGKPFR